MGRSKEWTPVQIGHTYCSPACGCGCSKASYDLAFQRAGKLVEQLGPKWLPVLWENCGWYYKAQLKLDTPEGFVEVRETGHIMKEGVFTYDAEIHPGPACGAVGLERAHGGIKASLQFFGHGDDPHTAVHNALSLMVAEAAALASAFRVADEALST